MNWTLRVGGAATLIRKLHLPRQEEWTRVVSRISSALAQYIAPIRSEANQSDPSAHHSLKPKKQNDSKEKKQSDPQSTPRENQNQQQQGEFKKFAPVIPLHPPKEEPEPHPIEATMPVENRAADSPAPSLIQLISLFQTQRETLERWLGKRTYAAAANRQSRGATQPGCILDEKADWRKKA